VSGGAVVVVVSCVDVVVDAVVDGDGPFADGFPPLRVTSSVSARSRTAVAPPMVAQRGHDRIFEMTNTVVLPPLTAR